MAYFDCIVGGSGKGNTVTVTCAEEFAGLTITLAKTGKTYTKTCPSTAPYVVTFNGVENGTYTVSCTVDGETYSETVVVQDISCVLNYGFNWKLWVDTASQLDSSDYDSLDEVLADEKALRELFLEHACVDYMASVETSNADLETIINDDYCAKWINNCDYALDFLGANTVIKALMDEADKYGYGEWVITDSTTTPPTWGPKGNVPVMTSNTAPYGTASGNSILSSFDYWKAFANTNTGESTSWIANGTSGRIYYRFTNPVCVKKVYFENRNFSGSSGNDHNGRTKSFIVQGSNDGSTWVDLTDTITRPNSDDAANASCEVTLTNSTYYLYYAINALSSFGTYAGLTKLQFYGRELKVSVPIMTSNTAPYGEAIGNNGSFTNSYFPWYAFDGTYTSQADSWVYGGNGSNVAYCGYAFADSVIVKYVKFITRNEQNSDTYTRAPKSMTLQGSNNGIDWVNVSDEGALSTPSNARDKTYTYTIDNALPYMYYRVLVNTVWDAGYVGIRELQFYGLDYSEKEFEVGATKKWLYDHGVELVPITITNTGTGSNAVKNDDNIYLSGGTGSQRSTGAKSYIAPIDLSSFSIMRVKLDKVLSSSSSTGSVLTPAVSNNIDPSYDWTNGYTSLADINIGNGNIPYNVTLDISAINESKTLALMEFVSSNNARIGTFTEWWLE